MLLLLLLPTSGINAQEPTNTPEPVPLYLTPTPLGTLVPYRGLRPCPDGGVPAGWGTVTPSPRWLMECAHCVPADAAIATVTPLAYTPPLTMPTAIPTLDLWATPAVTPLPTVTPVPTATPEWFTDTVTFDIFRYSGSTSCDYLYHFSGLTPVAFLAPGECWDYEEVVGHYPGTGNDDFKGCISTLQDHGDAAQVRLGWYLYAWAQGQNATASVYAYGDSDSEGGWDGVLYSAEVSEAGRWVNWTNAYVPGFGSGTYVGGNPQIGTGVEMRVCFGDFIPVGPQLPTATPEPTPTVTPTAQPGYDHCWEVEDIEEMGPDQGLPSIGIGHSTCYGTGAINFEFPIVGEVSIPAISVCFDRITMGEVQILGVSLDMDVISSAIAAIAVIRLLFRS